MNPSTFGPVSPPDTYTERRSNFVRAVEIAQDFHTPGEPVTEYTRGQAELICDLFDLGLDHKDVIAGVITGEVEPMSALFDVMTLGWTR